MLKLSAFLAILLSQVALGQKLILVGGALADDNAEVYNKFIELSTISGNSYIGVVTAASDPAQAEENGLFYANLIKKYGANKTIWIPLHLNNPDAAYDQKWVDEADKMSGIFFGGGDQGRLTQLLYQGSGRNRKNSPLLDIIKQNVKTGKTCIAGTSAGTAAQQSTPMVTGGESYYGLKYPTQKTLDSKGDLVSYEEDGGLGFLTLGLFVDTHFSCRGRDGRLIALIHDLKPSTGVYRGFGVDENTALIVNGNHGLILGQNGVSFFDLTNSSGSRSNGQLQVSNVRMHYLTNSDEIDLSTFKLLRYSCNKQNIKGKEKYSEPMNPPTDIFSSPDNVKINRDLSERAHPDQFKILGQDLFDSAKYSSNWGYSYETHPEFKVLMTKETSSEAYFDLDNESWISFYNLRIDITVTKNSILEVTFSIIETIKSKSLEIFDTIFNMRN